MNDIFKTSNRPLDLQVDEGLRRVQQRLLNTISPLTKVWALTDAIREGKSETLEADTFKLLELTVLGQSNVALNYHRRLSFMTRVLRSQKWAKQILKDTKEYFRKAHSALFGSSFDKTLRKLANVRKDSKQLADQLAMSSTVIYNTARGGSYRPFAKTRGFQEKSRGKYSKCAQNCTEEAQVDGSSNSEAPRNSKAPRNFRAPRSSKAPRTEGAKYLPPGEFLNKEVVFITHTKLQNCRPSETFSNKLEENNFRSRSAPDCIRLQSRIVRNTSSSQTPTGTQIFNTREVANRKRNKGARAGGKGSHQ